MSKSTFSWVKDRWAQSLFSDFPYIFPVNLLLTAFIFILRKKLVRILLIIFFFSSLLYYTHAQDEPWMPLSSLVGKSWVAEGKWADGSSFKQEKSFSYHLGEALITSESLGYTDTEQTTFGPRNHGVYSWDTTEKIIRFMEYDILGGKTEGRVISHEEGIFFQYRYGGVTLTDAWVYENDSTYEFIVGTFENGVWTQKYLETYFYLAKKNRDIPDFNKVLSGKWVAPAWEGELQETWQLDQHGHMMSFSLYVENEDTLYVSNTVIQRTAGEWLLLSVIKDSSPKIFKAVSWDMNSMVFENPDYSNPSQVSYTFLDSGEFHRTISWKENGLPQSYTFQFSRKE